jgi:hypothetical protein
MNSKHEKYKMDEKEDYEYGETTKDDLLTWFKRESPDTFGIEDDDGTYYP